MSSAGEPLRLDIIICTYNNAPLLDKTLAALAAQQVPACLNWGVLVVDNNSSDNTLAVVEAYQRAGTVPQLRVVSEPKQGLTPARRAGVLHTSADWLAFVDDDCLLQDDWVAQAAAFAETHPDCGAFGGKVILEWDTPPPAYAFSFGYAFAQQDHGPEAKEVSFLVGAGMVIRRAALQASGWVAQQLLEDRMGEKLVSGGDVEIALRIRGAGYPLWYTPDCQLRHLIPARRTTQAYLVDINYGLGASQVYADAMLWRGNYPSWFLSATRESLRASLKTALGRLKAALRRRRRVEAIIEASFARGRWVGIGRVLRMPPGHRRTLLGSASRASTLPWKVMNVDLDDLPNLPEQPALEGLFVIFWGRGLPLGQTILLATQLPVSKVQLRELALQVVTPSLGAQLFRSGFKEYPPVPRRQQRRLPADDPPALEALLSLEAPLANLQERLALSRTAAASTSIIVCTRERPEQLKRCLEALLAMSCPPKEIIVVDNAPTTGATRALVQEMPGVTYVLEPMPGLSAARNTGIRASTGSIIAFTDDDVVVHPDWLARLEAGFKEEAVMAVTGLILPLELRTEAQRLFQGSDAGFGWGYRALSFDQRYFDIMRSRGVPVWRIGAGANMAFRREAFERFGGFDERLGAGTSGCSEDSELWYRVLAEGWRCRYEPSSVVFHHHRESMEGLRQQMYQYMRGHTVALFVQFENYHHWGNLYRAFLGLPAYYSRRLLKHLIRMMSKLGNNESTLGAEMLGWLASFHYYVKHRHHRSRPAVAPISPLSIKERVDA